MTGSFLLYRSPRLAAWTLALGLLASCAPSALGEEKPAAASTKPAAASVEKSAAKSAEKTPDNSADKPAEKPTFEVRQWSVWLADAALDNVNGRDQYPTSLPLRVDTTRPRKLKNGKQAPSPLNVLTFRGQPVPLIDVDLRNRSGTFVGHYPTAQSQGSNRLRWLDNSLSTATDEEASLLKFPDHWFTRARASDALVVRKGTRGERFLTYDFESAFSLPLKLEGGPDKYELHSTSNFPLYDVVLVVPTPEGRRIAWLDVLPAAPDKKPAAATSAPAAAPNGAQPQPAPGAVPAPAAAVAAPVAVANVPVEGGPVKKTKAAATVSSAKTASLPPGPAVPLALSAPLAAGSPELAALSAQALSERLGRAELNKAEVELLLSLYQTAIFESDRLTVAFRLSPDAAADVVPVAIDPEPAKTLRVTLVIARNMDPKIITDLQVLVDQLGHAKYTEREAAEKNLHDLGSLAFPALKKAAIHTDPEIAFRAQRILVDQQQPIEAAPTPPAN